MKYLVTGATGGFGKYALEYLEELVPKGDIYALVRSEEKGASLIAKGFKLRIADYGNPMEMETALEGIDRLLFVSGAPGNRQAEHQNVINAAQKAGVNYTVYTSFPKADQATHPLAEDHLYTEKALKAAQLNYTSVRNNWYLENELPLIEAAIHSGDFKHIVNNSKAGWALKREYAQAAVNILVSNNYREVVELSGKPITYQELVAALNQATGKQLTVSSVDEQSFMESLEASGLPPHTAELFVMFEQVIAQNQLDVVSADFERVLNQPLTPLVKAFEEILN
ncbi:MAG: SDR family oxidoreductase [Enterococcus sp.]